MSETNNTITLYPTNWLYNAGVIGLLDSFKQVENITIENLLKQNGEVIIMLPFFYQLKMQERYFSDEKISSIVGKNRLYKNFLQATQKITFIEFVKRLDKIKSNGTCNICNNSMNLSQDDIIEIDQLDPGKAKFTKRIVKLNMIQNSELGPSDNEFPNSFWNMKSSNSICHLCNFILIHHHLAFTKLSDYTEIFINAPSFKIMYELNKIVKEAFGSSNNEEASSKREILATSVIEYSRKLQSTIGLWTGMNIEIVTKSKEGVDFFSLPYDTIKIISDRKIASALSDLGEFRILDIVLNRKYSQLTEIAYKLLRETTKTKRNDELLKGLLYRSNNRYRLTETANKILMLYSLVEEKIRRS